MACPSSCITIYTPHKKYSEGVTLSVAPFPMSGLGGYSGLWLNSDNLGLDESVPFTPAQSIDAGMPGTASDMFSETFNVTVLGYTPVDEPGNLYTGDVDGNAMDGLEITEATDANEIVLSYNPPAPPTIVYDVDFPDKPTLDIVTATIPGNDTNTGLLAVMPDLYYAMESVAIDIVDDVLLNLSTDAVLAFNEKIFNSDVSKGMSLMGIATPSAVNVSVEELRQKKTITRDLLIIDHKANNSTAGASALTAVNNVAEDTHALHQQARLDNAKLDVFIATQNMTLAVLSYNAEVQRANLEYMEFSKLVEVETKKLDLYRKRLQASGEALDGNKQLASAYRKQLSIVEQVFKSFEDDMQLSRRILQLATADINVETLNIKTSTLLIEGSTDQSNNVAYQAKTGNMAYGMNTEAELARDKANLVSERTRIASDLLALTKTIDNANIDSQNTTLSATAEAVAIKIRGIQEKFDLENTSSYNDAYLSDSSKHSRALRTRNEQQSKSTSFSYSMTGNVNAENSKNNMWNGKVDGNLSAISGLNGQIYKTACASEILSKANTEQTLNHQING